MKFRYLAQVSPTLDVRLQWLLYSARSSSFMTGDERQAFAISTASPNRLEPVPRAAAVPAAAPYHPCNRPSRLEFSDGGRRLLIGGMGYLTSLAYKTG